jgi:hypothetical protein
MHKLHLLDRGETSGERKLIFSVKRAKARFKNPNASLASFTRRALFHARVDHAEAFSD